jgi:hypothetical protein
MSGAVEKPFRKEGGAAEAGSCKCRGEGSFLLNRQIVNVRRETAFRVRRHVPEEGRDLKLWNAASVVCQGLGETSRVCWVPKCACCANADRKFADCV